MVHSLRNRKICTTSPESNDGSFSGGQFLWNDLESGASSSSGEELASFHQDMNSNVINSTHLQNVLNEINNTSSSSSFLNTIEEERVENHRDSSHKSSNNGLSHKSNNNGLNLISMFDTPVGSPSPTITAGNSDEIHSSSSGESHPNSSPMLNEDQRDLSQNSSNYALNLNSMFDTPVGSSSPIKRAGRPDENHSSSGESHPNSLMLNMSACIDEIIFERTYKKTSGVSVQTIKKQLSEEFCYNVNRNRNFINTYIKEAISNGKLRQTSGSGANGSVRLVKSYHKNCLKLKRKANKDTSRRSYISFGWSGTRMANNSSFVLSKHVALMALAMMDDHSNKRFTQCRAQIENRMKMAELRATTLSQVY